MTRQMRSRRKARRPSRIGRSTSWRPPQTPWRPRRLMNVLIRSPMSRAPRQKRSLTYGRLDREARQAKDAADAAGDAAHLRLTPVQPAMYNSDVMSLKMKGFWSTAALVALAAGLSAQTPAQPAQTPAGQAPGQPPTF